MNEFTIKPKYSHSELYFTDKPNGKAKYTTCKVCGDLVEQEPVGRTKDYCSDDCRRKAANARAALKYALMSKEARYEFNKAKKESKKASTKARQKKLLQPIYKLRERIEKKTEDILSNMEDLKTLLDKHEASIAALGDEAPVYRSEKKTKRGRIMKLVSPANTVSKGDDHE